ncbi:hypothetical protein C8Q80DRAFT_1192458 [Daedaleopsis nitida]|nr:hypothetical protein C8Q80DRAFT_1192458 [Daedaleopsis nitida]
MAQQPPLRVIMYQPPSEPGEPPAPLRPASMSWLKNPAHIDGALEEPQFYYTKEELRASHAAACAAAGLLELSRRKAPLPENFMSIRAASPPPQPISIPSSPISQPGTQEKENMAPAQVQAETPGTSPSGPEYLVQVKMNYIEQGRGAPQRGSKIQTRPQTVTKMVNAVLSGTSRTAFVRVILAAHGLEDQYEAGPLSGPPFKLWWTGVSKGQAGTIDRDSDYEVALGAILRKGGHPVVNVEFSLEDLNGFHVRAKRPFLHDASVVDEPSEELSYGTMVPRVDAFPDKTKLHGGIILELRRLHGCTVHVDENNQAGHCYKPAGRGPDAHIRLNNRRFKSWAAAIAAGEATKHVPPNNGDFDLTVGPKARGVGGPHAPPASPSPAMDPTQAMLMGLAPLLTALAGQHLLSSSSAPAPQTPKRSRQLSPPSSPLSPGSSELHQFLIALLDKKDVDLLESEASLAAKDYTPDILHQVDRAELKAMTGATDGKVIKMQMFAKEWTKRQVGKLRALY